MSWLSLLHKIVNLFPIRYRLVLDCFTLVKNKKTKSSQCLSNSRNREPTWDWLWARFKIVSLFCIIAAGLYINISETWLDPDILPIGPKNVVFWERKKKKQLCRKNDLYCCFWLPLLQTGSTPCCHIFIISVGEKHVTCNIFRSSN